MTESAMSGLSVGHFTTRRRRDADNGRAAVTPSRPQARTAASHPGAAARRGVAAHPGTRTTPDLTQYRAPWHASIITFTFGIAVAVALWIGWLNHDDNGLTPV